MSEVLSESPVERKGDLVFNIAKLMLDGASIRESWNAAFEEAQSNFKALLTAGPPGTPGWRRVPVPTTENKDVNVHRKGETYRVVLEVEPEGTALGIDKWRNIIVTPEMRRDWDPSVESSEILEMFDAETRVVKTRFVAGWPANPRDAITMSRTFSDDTTLIDISTSVPRSADEPGYLRPCPPYVRSHVSLIAWVIQLIPSPHRSQPRTRITLYHSHNFMLAWPLSSQSSAIHQQLPSLPTAILRTARSKGGRVPTLCNYGLDVSLESVKWNGGREEMLVDYSIHSETGNGSDAREEKTLTMEELQLLKERRKLERAIQLKLPEGVGWDIRVSVRSVVIPTNNSKRRTSKAQILVASQEDSEPWSVHLSQSSSSSQQLVLTLSHPSHAPLSSIPTLRISLSIEVVGSGLGIRVNGRLQSVAEENMFESTTWEKRNSDVRLVDDMASLNMSLKTTGSEASTVSGNSIIPRAGTRSPTAQKVILTRVKRNYIYFTSLLQEPEAKWKRYSENRGVTVSTLSSLDPTLLIYRAEAVFVGVGLWDMMSAVWNWGIRMSWDKSLEDASILEDLGVVSLSGMSELWIERGKGGWNASPRESVLLRTVYRSPTTLHVFAFSSDDSGLFPSIPLSPPAGYVRSQVDLQGFAIEALSPTTTSVTLLSQGMGQPTQLVSLLGGMGEYVIRNGAPPVLSALRGGKLRKGGVKYDVEKHVLKIEYEAMPSPTTDSPAGDVFMVPGDAFEQNKAQEKVECEMRCDMDSWASTLDLVIDPPPSEVTALRRHRLSASGGLWLTIVHHQPVATTPQQEQPGTGTATRILVLVRKGREREKGVVLVNGARVEVDVEEMDDKEVTRLGKKKRIKPERVPLDVPTPARRRRQIWDSEDEGSVSPPTRKKSLPPSFLSTPASLSTTAPIAPSPLARMWSAAVEQTQQAVSAVAPTKPAGDLSMETLPAQHALAGLAYLQRYHSRAHFEGWALANAGTGPKEKAFAVYRKQQAQISPNLPLYKGDKVLEGFAAEDVAGFVSRFESRKLWDDRFDGGMVLESYGEGLSLGFVTMKSVFPFRDRGFYVSCATGRLSNTPTPGGGLLQRTASYRGRSDPSGLRLPQDTGYNTTIFYATASFQPEHASAYGAAKYNQYNLPVGRIFLDGWIFETLDPYTTTEHYAIPSTRCTRLVAIDFAGSIPSAYNSSINSSMPRSILNLEAFLKRVSPRPLIRVPTNAIFVEESDDDDGSSALNERWTLRGVDEERSLVSASMGGSEENERRIFRATAKIKPNLEAYHSQPHDVTPRPRQMSLISSSPSFPRTESDDESGPGTAKQFSSLGPAFLRNRTMTTPTRPGRSQTISTPSTSPDTIRHRRVSSTSSSGSRPGFEPTSSQSTVGLTLPAFSSTTTISSIGFFDRRRDDYLVAELVIDNALYSDGYNIQLTSDLDISGTDPLPLWVDTSAKLKQNSSDAALPLHCSVYTLPSSTLQTSHPSTTASPRHLLRITLPTSQYFPPKIEDPLTDEMHEGPDKPDWVAKLQDGGARVDIAVSSRSTSGGDAPGKGERKGGLSVWFDGMELDIVGEKDSLSQLGRHVLEGGAVRRGHLHRSSNRALDEDPLPKCFMRPLAIANHLQEPAPVSAESDAAETAEVDDGAGQDEERLEESSPNADNQRLADAEASSHAVIQRSSFMGFFSGSLLRLSNGSAPTGVVQKAPIGSPLALLRSPGVTKDFDHRRRTAPVTDGSKSAAARSTETQQRMYPLATVIFVALISFLIGSLLRSLLSPAEFVRLAPKGTGASCSIQDNERLVVDNEHGLYGAGWREIKRLVEIKYLVGGWDLLVAVVRRH